MDISRYSNNLSDSFPQQTPRECLLRILFGNPTDAREAAQALSANSGWPAAFQSAESWSVAPQLADTVQTLQLQPPERSWRDFRRNMIGVFSRSASRASKGIAALRHLEGAGIPAAAFKGLASAARLYPSPGKRTIKDADLLVERQNLEAALQSLSAIGFAPLESHQPEKLDRFMDNSPGFSGNKAIVLYGPDGFELDLHWSAGPGMDAATLLQRSERVTLLEKTIRIVAPEDAVMLTTRHAVREDLAVDAMCRDLFDIRLSCDFLAGRGCLDAACQTWSAGRSMVPLLAITGILQSLDGRDGGVKEAQTRLAGFASPRDRRTADRLRDLFFCQVKEGPVSKDLFYLAHSRPARQILAGAWSNWREYRNMMRSLEEKLDGAEVPLSRRLRMLGAAIWKTGPAPLRSIRALARLKFVE